MKYYFIYYSCYRTNWPQNLPINDNTTFNQDIINIHPLQWQIEANRKYDKQMPLGNGFYSENYKIVNWQELTIQEYKQFNRFIG